MGIKLSQEERRGIAFVAPGLIITILLILYPVFSVLKLSFSSVAVGGFDFAGFANYTDVFQSPRFMQMIGNTVLWTAVTVSAAYVLGTFAAVLLDQPFIKGKGIWRTLLMLSWITPGVVKAVLWKWLYSQDFGMLNHMLQNLHLIREPVSWLGNPDLAIWSVILVQVWETFPFVMLMMSAGLQAVPKDLYEVADLEGANAAQRLRYILLPLLKDVSFIALLTLIIWSLNGFTLIWILTQGGPIGSTAILSLSIYDQFRSFHYNSAAAISILQLLVSFIFAVWYIRRAGKEG